MKKILPLIYLFTPTALAFAHGEVDDGHVETVAVADPSQRIYVLGGVIVVLVLVAVWFIWSKWVSNRPQ
ncbi:MAG: hypothetical protein A3C93_04765 [Candidatus Lloydbacteria bacterium RIFCSPHIGHO2_02_FULL_54_17]|uniref:CcmD family protein n=1 Tax=Candidatus Lloydbacteria bacterium RIFCSPHIGHO2_02_FULL_54_17 TaxID=1798664 RepID=A0A1G2DHW2_9BACT|nr:MAG: hypothetical protein A2762_01675 [Candidatus Lloydbacteria bacterium RIFCSPHIGHO2_01_FULL_54_11]OGZ12460.1 MAG: hypothetical protein A3C93_04765 [Candidatus Lloydbacteria bacterium RIFCSPHIGHO2_02_FULL_54_17]OGZ14719.1 MAG: hypothetical protein A2948_04445 [Candidatus Lloydbacteria bacterium RIFCSPLOWO2_01_FULL_54_18]OGZ16746.1 MAG: hypothetical protein A3H76_02345 [Candidatus Lloydbacteria bacterium RIFCSPLOWO2_02_FULL_54_12]